jgi:transketolase
MTAWKHGASVFTIILLVTLQLFSLNGQGQTVSIPLTAEAHNFLAHQALQIRINAINATTAAQSGHPTSCLSAADMIAVLFFATLRYDYNNPAYANNDRFILSKGHAIPVVYAALRQLGVMTEAELLSLRKVDSPIEGHPTPRYKYNEAATGSLGQGLGVGVGMALYARHHKLVYRTYVMMGDGEMAEGSVWEALALAAHENLDNIIGFVDCNRLGQSDQTAHAHHVEQLAAKCKAFGWTTLIIDGHNLNEIVAALQATQTAKGKPVMIIAKTFKGSGLEGIENHAGFHGKPFNQADAITAIDALKKRFADVAVCTGPLMTPPLPARNQPGLAVQAPRSADQVLAPDKKLSPRKAFGLALAELGVTDERTWALDADVKNSTFTELFEAKSPDRFVQCFIAEQNMVSVATGLTLRGGVAYAATFGAFFTRCYDQVRMAGIGCVPLRLCGSHAGVAIGQDGPSQMALEDISMMRAIPNSIVLYPSDGVSAYALTLQMANYTDGVSYMKATRGDAPLLYPLTEQFPIGGCKVLRSSASDQACIVAAGTTVYEALDAYQELKAQGIMVAVIDAYSVKPLDAATIINVAKAAGAKVITVEDHYIQGGLGEAVVVGCANAGLTFQLLAVTELSRSGKPEELLALAGINSAAIVAAVKNTN